MATLEAIGIVGHTGQSDGVAEFWRWFTAVQRDYFELDPYDEAKRDKLLAILARQLAVLEADRRKKRFCDQRGRNTRFILRREQAGRCGTRATQVEGHRIPAEAQSDARY